MQTPPQAPTPAPSADAPAQAVTPATAPTPPVQIITVGPDGKPATISLPSTEEQVRELLAQRDELSSQLTGVASRRREHAPRIAATTDAGIGAGPEGRRAIPGPRILQRETELATSGRQRASAPTEPAGTAESRKQGRNDAGFDEGF